MAPPRRLPSRRSALLLVLLAALVAGCQDYATTPTLPGAATHGSAAGTGGAAEITSPYTCLTSIATPGGQYRRGRLQLTFSKEALPRDGSRMRYQYRGYARGAVLDRQADCTIPRSAVAVEMMHRRFGVHDKLTKKGGTSSDGGVTILSTDIDGIVITACQYGGEYPNCNPPPPPPTGYQEDPNPPATDCSTYCDPWSDDGGGGSGGGDGVIGEGNDEAPTYCHSLPASGCTPYRPDDPQRNKIAGEIAKMRTDGICGEAKALAERFLSNEPSQFKVWDGDVRDGHDQLVLGDYQPRVIPDPAEIHLSAVNGITSATIAHEAIHALGYSHGFIARFPDGKTRELGAKSSTDVLGNYCG